MEVIKRIEIQRGANLNLNGIAEKILDKTVSVNTCGLRPDDFFIKKVCLGAKNKKKILVGNMNTFRDYSWVTDIVKAIFLTSNLKTKDYIISKSKNSCFIDSNLTGKSFGIISNNSIQLFGI